MLNFDVGEIANFMLCRISKSDLLKNEPSNRSILPTAKLMIRMRWGKRALKKEL